MKFRFPLVLVTWDDASSLPRHRRKGKAEDIRKAMHFCELILRLEYGEK